MASENTKKLNAERQFARESCMKVVGGDEQGFNRASQRKFKNGLRFRSRVRDDHKSRIADMAVMAKRAGDTGFWARAMRFLMGSKYEYKYDEKTDAGRKEREDSADAKQISEGENS